LNAIEKTQKITIFGMIINIVLSFLKILFGYFGKSSALIADGVHSFSDLLSDFAILLGVKAWSKSADQKHPYGHSRLETFVSTFIAFLLLCVALGIIVSAIKNWLKGIYHHPSLITLIIAFLSIVVKEYLYRRTKKIAEEINSSALIANAWHHRSDSLSSIPVFVSILLSLINPGLRFFDYIGAIVVSFFILSFTFTLLRSIFGELMETSAPKAYLEQVIKIITGNTEIKAYHCLRSRKVGSTWFLDVHIQIDENFTVKQGHDIAAKLKADISQKIPNIGDVLIHIEPYNELQTHNKYEKIDI